MLRFSTHLLLARQGVVSIFGTPFSPMVYNLVIMFTPNIYQPGHDLGYPRSWDNPKTLGRHQTWRAGQIPRFFFHIQTLGFPSHVWANPRAPFTSTHFASPKSIHHCPMGPASSPLPLERAKDTSRVSPRCTSWGAWWTGETWNHQLCPTLWLCQNSYWKWPFIVSFPMKNGDFP